MGTDDPESYPYERPAHRVKVDGFWMDATEVTNAQFRFICGGYRIYYNRRKETDLGGT